MASLDVRRPAAQEQLKVLGEQAGVFTLPIVAGQQPVDIAKRAMEVARLSAYDVVLLDTAGRLHIDEELMDEAFAVKRRGQPGRDLLVADAMTGQDAVTVADSFNQRIGLTGIVLTRVDGDARGGAALSMRAVTGCPIKLIGTGEKLEDLEGFHPDRIAGRILGMGDVVSLVEKAAETVDEEEAEALAKKMQKGDFDLNDMAKQLRQMRKMGGLGGLMSMLPGVGKMKDQMAKANVDDKPAQAPGGDHRVDDAGRTAQPEDHPRLAQAQDRRRLRHLHPGGQQAAEAAHDHVEDDEEDAEDGQEGPDAPRHARHDAARVPVTRRRGPERAFRFNVPIEVRKSMSLKIRLSRGGAKKRPFYRIVVADLADAARRPVHREDRHLQPDGAQGQPERVVLEEERAEHWLKVGAKPSDRVARFLSAADMIELPERREQTKKNQPKAKAQERLREAEEKAKAAAEAEGRRGGRAGRGSARRGAPAEEAPAEEARRGSLKRPPPRRRRPKRPRPKRPKRPDGGSGTKQDLAMTERRKLCVAVVTGAHGVRGAVRLKSFTAEPEDVAGGLSVR